MLLIFRDYIHAWLFLLGLLHVGSGVGTLYEGDICEWRNNSSGICTVPGKCQLKLFKINGISSKQVVRCGFTPTEELICCPVIETTTTTTLRPKPQPQPQQPSGTDGRTDRVSVKACKIIEASLHFELTTQILNGEIVKPGEYPHMAAIGFAGLGSEGDEIRCGGTLIHERFVLTAAHCVSGTRDKPSFVRLGISNFDDKDEIPNSVEVSIKEIHIHPEYRRLNRTDDIALIELVRPIQKTRFIAPTCLYTDDKNPSQDAELSVSGWGQYKSASGNSRKLLKASISIVDRASCWASYELQGTQLRDSQLCAADERHNKNDGVKDACKGDSGGPLIMVKSVDLKSYAVVGITSFGFNCGTDLPGIYTKVSHYLDFIESIVWPLG